MPTRKTAYDAKRRQQAQKESKAQQARAAEKAAEFRAWLSTTNYRLVGSVSKLTEPAVFRCKTCKAERTSTPFNMWRKNRVAPVCLTCQFDSKLPEGYTRVSTYGTRVVLKHECGAVKEYVSGTFLRGGSSCDCLRKRNWRSPDGYRTEVKQHRNGEFTVEQDYVSGKTPIWHRHVGGCGKRFKQTPNMFLGGSRCPKCDTGVVWTQAKTEKALIGALGKSYLVAKPGQHMRDGWKIKHVACGQSFTVKPEYVIHKSQTEVPCPFCRTTIGKRFNVFRHGKRFQLQGTEKLALDILLVKANVKAQEVAYGKQSVPVIDYLYKDKRCRYYPDFYIATKNLVVESKDLNTFGLGCWFEDDVFDRNCAKAKAVLSSGHRFKMLVFKNGAEVQLPKQWWTMTKAQVAQHLSQSTHKQRSMP